MRREGLGVVPGLVMHITLHWVAAAPLLAIFAPDGLAIVVHALWSTPRMSACRLVTSRNALSML